MSTHLLRKILQRDSSLSQQSLDLLTSSLSEPLLVPAGSDIVSQGSRPEECTLIVGGWGSRYNALADGRRQMVALHFSGDFVDLHSFPLKVMDHSVGAITDCVIASVQHPEMRQITETDPHLTRVLWLLTLIDAAILRRWLLGSGQQSSLEHAAHLICELFTRLHAVGLAEVDAPFSLPVSQEQFGDALGISAVHVSRTVTELRNRNLFVWRRGMAEIRDWAALRQLAEFDPTYLSLTDEAR